MAIDEEKLREFQRVDTGARGRGGEAAGRGPGLFPGSPRLEQLVATTGERWSDFRRTLAPRYGVVYAQLASDYALIVAGLAAQCAVAWWWGDRVGLWTAPVAALWIGYWLAAVFLFLHEAGHFNLHPRRAVNDRLANLLFCSLFGQTVARYRAKHWRHHLHLGLPEDTEISYHHAPTARFVLESLSGVHALRVLRGALATADDGERRPRRVADWLAVGCALVVHGTIAALCVAAGIPTAALAWVLAVGVVFPFLAAMRQLLEHRASDAPLGVDFRVVPHGPINRLFGRDAFSRTFGAAGFNRHLLHHWYPSASYTTFDDLEAYLMRTELAPLLDSARTSYWAIWRHLSRAGRQARG